MPLDIWGRTRATSAYGRLNFSLPPAPLSAVLACQRLNNVYIFVLKVALVTTVAVVELI